ncbi:MAG: hypothetical protein P8188_03600 [Gemmatimonadota bacterium]
MRRGTEQNPPVFVVSTGRAGSRMIAWALGTVDSVFAVHEPLPHLVTEAYLRWRGRLSGEDAEMAVRHKRENLYWQVLKNGLTYVESAHYCSHFIPELDRIFGARFVFLHRNPADFVRSGLRRGWYAEPDLRERLYGFVRRRWRIEVGDLWRDHRLDPPPEFESRLERLAWLWCEINGTILDGLESVDPERCFELRLDSVGRDRFRELLEFIGVPADADVVERMIRTAAERPDKEPLRERASGSDTPWDERALQRITGRMARRLGYDG